MEMCSISIVVENLIRNKTRSNSRSCDGGYENKVEDKEEAGVPYQEDRNSETVCGGREVGLCLIFFRKLTLFVAEEMFLFKSNYLINFLLYSRIKIEKNSIILDDFSVPTYFFFKSATNPNAFEPSLGHEGNFLALKILCCSVLTFTYKFSRRFSLSYQSSRNHESISGFPAGISDMLYLFMCTCICGGNSNLGSFVEELQF